MINAGGPFNPPAKDPFGGGVSPRRNAAVLTERWLVGLPTYFWSSPCAGAVGTPLAPTDIPLFVPFLAAHGGFALTLPGFYGARYGRGIGGIVAGALMELPAFSGNATQDGAGAHVGAAGTPFGALLDMFVEGKPIGVKLAVVNPFDALMTITETHFQAMRGGIAIGSVDWKNETDPIVAHANAPPNNATVTFVARPSPMTLKHVFTDHGAKLGGILAMMSDVMPLPHDVVSTKVVGVPVLGDLLKAFHVPESPCNKSAWTAKGAANESTSCSTRIDINGSVTLRYGKPGVTPEADMLYLPCAYHQPVKDFAEHFHALDTPSKNYLRLFSDQVPRAGVPRQHGRPAARAGRVRRRRAVVGKEHAADGAADDEISLAQTLGEMRRHPVCDFSLISWPSRLLGGGASQLK